jgi:GMP synthase-like glutamine amidotransferase
MTVGSGGPSRGTASGASRIRALVIQQEAVTPGGLILDWLRNRGAKTTVIRIDLAGGEVDIGSYDLLIPLGSEFPPYSDEIGWIPREAELLGKAHEAGTPVLGFCFGGQLLARALGARTYRGEVAEIGWRPVRSRDPGFVSEGPWFQWHFDYFDLPDGAELLAETDAGPQAFVIGQSMGIQFHPEVTMKIMDDWVRAYRHELDAEGVDPDDLMAETRRRLPASATAARQLFDTFLDRVAKLGGGHR